MEETVDYLGQKFHENYFMNAVKKTRQIKLQFHVIFIYLFFLSNCGTFFRGFFWRKINKTFILKQILQHFAEPEVKTLAGRQENSNAIMNYFRFGLPFLYHDWPMPSYLLRYPPKLSG